MTGSLYSAIALSAVATIILRSFPVLLLSHWDLPQAIREWLSFVPAAIMAAIVTAELIQKPQYSESGFSISLLAAFVAALAGTISRSLFLTVVAGILAFLVGRTLLG